MKKRKKIVAHLKGDIKGYKKEIQEDKELIKELKEKKNGKEKLSKKSKG